MIWGDPALAASPDAHTVYLANLAGSDVYFPSSGQVIDETPILDGFCVAKSVDGGVTFSEVRCFKNGTCSNTGASCTGRTLDCFQGGDPGHPPTFGTCNGQFYQTNPAYDGNTLATWQDQVFYAACHVPVGFEVWRSTGNSLEFYPLADLKPFGDMQCKQHPRLRVHGTRLYVVGEAEWSDGKVYPTEASMDLTQGEDATWSDPLRVGVQVFLGDVTLGDKALRRANEFSYDIGPNSSGQDEFRTAYTRVAPDGRLYIEYATCSLPLVADPNQPEFAACSNETGWGGPNHNMNADEFSPELRVSGSPAMWRSIWKVRPLGTGIIGVDRGNLATLPNDGPHVLVGSQLVAPQVPCTPNPDINQEVYWGDYDDLLPLTPTLETGFTLRPHWITPFTQNFDGCAFSGDWTAAMHVGAVKFDD